MADIIQFPDPMLADDEGLVAVGGELSVDFLVSAYSQGIFPWFCEGQPMMWWSPNPRMVLFPDEFIVSKSLAQKIRNRKFTIKMDTCFDTVIRLCSEQKRKDQDGTWITSDMIDAYTRMYEEGYAHSVETYYENNLTGGLYGISLGRAFFGESMFYRIPDASKIALYALVQISQKMNFHFIDAQQSTKHLKSLGAGDVERKVFMKMLRKALEYKTVKKKWTNLYGS